MSPPASQIPPTSLGPAYLLARSASLFVNMVAARRYGATDHPVCRTHDAVLAELTATVDRLPPELPSLVGALAMRGAVFGAHGAQVAA